MNKENVLSYLMRQLGDILTTRNLIPELVAILSESGNEAAFFKQLAKCLRILAIKGICAIELDGFENIGQGIFSMRLPAKGYNIRILYGFLPNSKPVLLLAFYERGGKRKTDYTPYLEPARKRLEEEEKRFNEN